MSETRKADSSNEELIRLLQPNHVLLSDRIDQIVRPLKKAAQQLAKRVTSYFTQEHYDPNFNRIKEYASIEAMVALSFQRHLEQIINAGWYFKGKNPKAVAYIKSRLYEMGQRMGEPYETVVDAAVSDAVRYNNALVHFSRNTNLSPGKPIAFERGNRFLPPIVAMENLSVPGWIPEIDENTNRVTKWKPYRRFAIGNVVTKLPFRDVMHVFLNRHPGEVYGTPWVTPALDDIQDLRAIEAIVNIIIQQQGAPLIHVKIEKPIIDREKGTSEIMTVRGSIARGDLSGGYFVTDSRISIDAVSNEAAVSAFQWVVDHYKDRARLGLNLSDIDMGSGSSANRNTATSLTEKGVARCKYIAISLEYFFNFYLISPLLAEGGYKWDAESDQDLVEFRFNEIDLDSKMRKEVHQTLLWEANNTTHAEYRLATGKEPMADKDMEQLHVKVVTEAQMEAKQRLASQNQHGVSNTPKQAKDSVERLKEEAWEHYKDGATWSGKTAVMGKEDLYAYLSIDDKIARNEEQSGEAVELDKGMTAIGNYVRSASFLLGSSGNS